MKKKINIFLFFLVLTFTNLVTGCGWKFKVSDENMPFEFIYLSGTNNSVGKELITRVKRIPNVKVTNSIVDAQVILKLNVKNEKVVVGFSGAGRPRELEIRTTVKMEVTNQEGKTLHPMDEIKIFRSVNFNDTDVLATQAHENFHIKDINKQVSLQIIDKLQRINLSKEKIKK